MIRIATHLGLIAATTLLAVSCAPSSGLNLGCTLVKKDPTDSTGQRSTFITNADIKSNAARDVISFGAVECEDLVCIREGGAPLVGTDTDVVKGWCSRPCPENSTDKCPSDDPALDKVPLSKLSCRKLLLDEAALAALKTQDPALFKRYFGDTTSPFFCARDVVAPATNP